MTKKCLQRSFFCATLYSLNSKNMEVKEIMSLQYFAKRIGVSAHRLNWCIVYTKNRNRERNIFPAVSIKNAALCYDFMRDHMEGIVNYGSNETIIYDAKMTEIKGGYRFEAGKTVIEISSAEIADFYRNKVYSEELNHEAKRFA